MQSLAVAPRCATETGTVTPMNFSSLPFRALAVSPTNEGDMALKAYIVEDNALIRVNLIETLEEILGIETLGYSTTEDDACSFRTPNPVP